MVEKAHLIDLCQSFTFSGLQFPNLPSCNYPPPPIVHRNKRKWNKSDISDSILSQHSKTNSSESSYGFWKVLFYRVELLYLELFYWLNEQLESLHYFDNDQERQQSRPPGLTPTEEV